MSEIMHERPGVYSSYEASTLVTGNEGAKVVGLAVLSEEGTPGTAVLVTYVVGSTYNPFIYFNF